MPAHPVFAELRVPGDDELARALGSVVVSRVELQAWPLAVTEQIRLRGGRRYVAKTQVPPTVEPQFYATARSPLLAPCLDLGVSGRSRVIVVDWVEGSPLDTADPDEFLRLARRTVDEIAAIGGDPPVHLDLSTGPALQSAARATTARLHRLVEAGRFAALSSEDVATVQEWASSARTVAAATKDPGVVHADLSPDEVLVTGDGELRVIDWQRPVRGPREIDLVSLLRSGGIDPGEHLDHVFVQLEAFVLLHWAALCATEVLPDVPADAYQAWAVGALATLAPG